LSGRAVCYEYRHTALVCDFVPQGIGADLLATLYGFSREDVDAYAMESQRRAAHAWDNGFFDNSVVPIRDHIGMTLLD